MDEELIFDPSQQISANDLQRRYSQFCQSYGVEPISPQSCGSHLRHKGAYSASGRAAGKVIKLWKGVSLKSSVTDVAAANPLINKPLTVN